MMETHLPKPAANSSEVESMAKPIKSLHLTNSWHETSGGIATFYRALIGAANRRGHYLRLVVPGERDRVEEIGEFGRIYYVKSARAPFNPDYRVIYPGQYLATGSALQKILIAERPDVVEICDKYTLAYLGILLRRGLLRGLGFRPVVVGLSCERMDDNFRSYVGQLPLSRTFCAVFMKWLYFPFFDHHIANSKYTAEELRTASQGQEITRQVWIRPMGVALSGLSPARRSCEGRQRLLEKCGGRKDSVLLVYAGRLAPEKNLQLLFDLLVRLVGDAKRDYRLLVAGDGIERGHWEAFCQKHVPGRAEFLGHIRDRNEFADLLANADIFVHPNPDEPFGIAPLEAMASGLPLVAPNRGGVTSYANLENAWVADPSAEKFSVAVEETVTNELVRSQKVQCALGTASEYSWESVAPSFLDLYTEMHFASVHQKNELPGSAFASTPARGARLAWFRGISQCTEKMFRVASAFFSRSIP